MTDGLSPRLLVEGFECFNGPGAPARRSIGMLDLTDPITEALLHARLASPAPDRIPINLFASALGREAAAIAWAGRLAIPSFAAAIDRFVEVVGGIGGIREFRLHLKAVEAAASSLTEAEALQSKVASARFVPHEALGDAAGMFHCAFGSEDDYVEDPAEAYGTWRRDEYDRSHPRPDADFDATETQAWREGYRVWARREKPPIVFLTTLVPFAGVDAATIREAFEDEGRVDLPDILSSACDDHHEDAVEQLVDECQLHEIVRSWLPHAGKGTREDIALETGVAAWNARQTLESFEPDFGRCTGTSHDVDADEIARWCERNVDRARERLTRVKVWRPAPDACASRAA